VAYDSGKNEVFVGCENYQPNNITYSVWVISDINNTVVAKIPVSYCPSDLIYDSGKGEIFIADNTGLPNSDSVTVISDSNNTVVANIIVGTDPYNLAYDSGKGEVFVTDFNDNTVAVISDATDSVVAYVTVGYYATAIAYDSEKGEIYVGVSNYTTADGYVSVISDTNNTVIATIPHIPNPGTIAYDSGKSELFVTLSLSGKIAIISDCPNLTSPTISAASTSILQGQTSVLTLAPLTTGTSPYTYQWFAEAPNATAYTTIDNATLPSYNFTTTTATAAGNWTFMLQVTDATGAVVNSTATQIVVDAPTPPSAINVSGLGAKDLTAAAVAIILAAVVTAVLLLRKKGTKKRIKENQT
jgi:YVTN family beta-propeller protein